MSDPHDLTEAEKTEIAAAFSELAARDEAHDAPATHARSRPDNGHGPDRRDASAGNGSAPDARAEEARSALARLLGAGAKATDRLAHATGVDRALDDAMEEALVRALRSPGVERAIVRVIRRNAIQDALADSLTSDEVATAIIAAIESEAADRVWAEILASPKAQMLTERIAEAPEVRAAITQQSVGLITDVGARLTQITEALDDALERVIGGARHDAETDQVGLVTRLVAAATDVALGAVAFSLTSTFVASVFPFATGDRVSLPVLLTLVVLGVIAAGSVVASFWALTGQTPGMRFLSIRLEADGSREIGVRRAVKRLFALPIAVLPAALGMLAIIRSPQRQGWHDRIAGTEVVYDSTRRVAPHSQRPGEGALARDRAA